MDSKREKIGKGNPPIETRFSSTNQPENAGRKPKLLKHLNDELKTRGFEPVSPSHIQEALETILNLPKDEIITLQNEETVPYFVRIICKRIVSGESEFEALEKLLDRAIGKPKQSIDHTSKGQSLAPNQKLSDDEIKAEIEKRGLPISIFDK